MTIMKTYCDCCKKEMSHENGYIDCLVGTPSDSFEVDLCYSCEEELTKKISDFLGRN